MNPLGQGDASSVVDQAAQQPLLASDAAAERTQDQQRQDPASAQTPGTTLSVGETPPQGGDAEPTQNTQPLEPESDWPPVGNWPQQWFAFLVAMLAVFGYTFFAIREERFTETIEFIRWGCALDQLEHLGRVRRYLWYDCTCLFCFVLFEVHNKPPSPTRV